MLVLTRKETEKILIGDDIEVTVLSVEGGQVQIGIEAPRDITILREEVINEVKKDNLQSSQVKADKLKEIINMMKIREKGLSDVEK